MRIKGHLAAIRLLVSKNGVCWTLLFGVSVVLTGVVRAVEGMLQWLESRYKLRGFYSASIAREIWNRHDWQRRGEEWTVSPEWKDALVSGVMYRWLPPGGTAVEIGPGAGRWSEPLARAAGRLILVDVSSRSLELCRQRFAGLPNIEYRISDGTSLPTIPDDTVDFIWSFDTFVHISPEDTADYVEEFGRVLRTGGHAVIHHAGDGGWHGRWRTRMTSRWFRALVRQQGLEPLVQFAAWGDRAQFRVPVPGDAITVFVK